MKLPKTAAPFSGFPIKTNETDSLKKFPKGILFAFSGVFFLLTLLVLFQSKEPFGIAAVIAYISCLTLTILLFSAPYFASYFINYYKKLHQIEEAILLLSDQGKSNLKQVDEVSALPPYSAVSALTDEEHAEMLQGNDDSGVNDLHSSELSDSDKNSGEENRSPSESESRVGTREVDDQTNDSSGSSVRKPAPKKKSKSGLTSEDEFQLSLFDIPQEAVEIQTEADMEPKVPDDSVAQNDSEIHAFLLLDGSAKLFIRGDAPFSWDKGIELKSLDVGKFTTEAFTVETPINVKFLINDNEKKISEEFVIEPGILNECYPEI